jgi:hypothetical protein
MTDADKAKPTKQEREHAARVAAIAKKGELRPPSSDLTEILAAGKPQAKIKPTIADQVLVPAQVLIAPGDLEQAAGGRRRLRRVSVAHPGAAHPPAAASPVVPPPAAAKPASTPPAAATTPAAEAVAPAAAAVPPWAGASVKFTHPFPLRLSDELHLKLAYLAERLPGRMSMQRLIIAATEPFVDELLAKHYPPPAE